MHSSEWQIIAFTAGMAMLATVLMAPAGVAVAWLLARRRWRGKSVVETLVALPLVLPPVVTGLALLELFGPRGRVGGWLQASCGLDVVFTWRAVVLALAVMALPLLVRTARAAFESVDTAHEHLARTLGAGEWRVFLTITLPLARRGVLAGLLLSFARALGEFGATVMVAGCIPGRTVTTAIAIYQSVQTGDDGRAWALAAVSGGLAFAAVWSGEAMLTGVRGRR